MKISPQSLADLPNQARKKHKENVAFFRQLASKPPGKVDEAFQNLHEQIFEEVNCLDCGNCCKSLGPRITDTDISRVSAALRLKAADFTAKYLRVDEDGDYVFITMPCPFIDADNYCKIYENRPRACRDYPHTDRRRMQQILDITLKNTSTCPAVFEIVEQLKTSKL